MEHNKVRFWGSEIETGMRQSERPDGGALFEQAGGAYCTRCGRHWGWPRTRKAGEPEPASGTWRLYLHASGALEVAASGRLDGQQVRELANALQQARRCIDAGADKAAQQADPGGGEWQLAVVEGRHVLHRCEGKDQRTSFELVKVMPRKTATCGLCKADLAAGAQAWRAVKIYERRGSEMQPWNTRHQVASDWLSKFRACVPCVALLSTADPGAPDPGPSLASLLEVLRA